MGGGLLLIIGLFLTWYHADTLAKVNGTNGDLSGWDVHPILRWLLILGGLAPFILAWIIARDHALSWPRGEMTAVVSVAAFGLIAYNAFVSKPGDPSSLVHLRFGVFVALLGTILMFSGSALRSSDVERARKPPGTI
jgi:glucan phosphoethanolaminetransferase (alkaline phosphatase superfamily)